MKWLSEDGTTMFLLSHIISFSPVATQRIKGDKDPLNQSSSKFRRVDKLPSTEGWTLHWTPQPGRTGTLRNNGCTRQLEWCLLQPLMSNLQTSNTCVERKTVHLTHKEVKPSSSKSHNSQRVETTQTPIYKWMDKQNIVYTYNGILLSLKKEGNSDTCNPHKRTLRISETSQSQKNKKMYDPT